MNNKSKEVVIVSAIRTPIGTYRGSLKNMRPDQLGSIIIKEILNRSKFSQDEIDEVSDHFHVSKTENLTVPNLVGERHLVWLKKK